MVTSGLVTVGDCSNPNAAQRGKTNREIDKATDRGRMSNQNLHAERHYKLLHCTA